MRPVASCWCSHVTSCLVMSSHVLCYTVVTSETQCNLYGPGVWFFLVWCNGLCKLISRFCRLRGAECWPGHVRIDAGLGGQNADDVSVLHILHGVHGARAVISTQRNWSIPSHCKIVLHTRKLWVSTCLWLLLMRLIFVEVSVAQSVSAFGC